MTRKKHECKCTRKFNTLGSPLRVPVRAHYPRERFRHNSFSIRETLSDPHSAVTPNDRIESSGIFRPNLFSDSKRQDVAHVSEGIQVYKLDLVSLESCVLWPHGLHSVSYGFMGVGSIVQ